MGILVMVVQWLHVLFGVIWLGGSLYGNLVLFPSLMKLPFSQQQTIMPGIAKMTDRLFTFAAVMIVLLGILRGTVFGPLQSLSAIFGTVYGLTWLTALVLTIATAFWGAVVVGKRIGRVQTKIARMLHSGLDESKIPMIFGKEMQVIKTLALMELVGFFLIFTCMILMRFGL